MSSALQRRRERRTLSSFRSPRHDFECSGRHRALSRLRFIPRRQHPDRVSPASRTPQTLPEGECGDRLAWLAGEEAIEVHPRTKAMMLRDAAWGPRVVRQGGRGQARMRHSQGEMVSAKDGKRAGCHWAKPSHLSPANPSSVHRRPRRARARRGIPNHQGSSRRPSLAR